MNLKKIFGIFIMILLIGAAISSIGMNYKQSIDWLYSFKQYGSKLGLERISSLVKQLDKPQNNFKIIHVTGTNGKGSVCQYIGSILQQAGYKTGIYISPHLQRFSERITIDNKEISKGVHDIKPTSKEPSSLASMSNDKKPINVGSSFSAFKVILILAALGILIYYIYKLAS